jgi:hypothetical protein
MDSLRPGSNIVLGSASFGKVHTRNQLNQRNHLHFASVLSKTIAQSKDILFINPQKLAVLNLDVILQC